MTVFQLVKSVAIAPAVATWAYRDKLPENWVDNPASVPAEFWVFAIPAAILVPSTLVLFILAAIRAGKSSRAAAFTLPRSGPLACPPTQAQVASCGRGLKQSSK